MMGILTLTGTRLQELEGKRYLSNWREQDTALNTATSHPPEKLMEANIPKPTLNRFTWLDYKRNYDKERNINEEHAIDILKDVPIILYNVWRNGDYRNRPIHLRDRNRHLYFFNLQEPSAGKMQREVTPETEQVHYPVASCSSIPDRIRINGEALVQPLDKALELGLENPDNPIVTMRSFKVLIQHSGRIRRLYQQLTRKL